jgi:type I restriction enzyme R subunit
MFTYEEVVQELLKLAKEMLHASEEGNLLGLTYEELAFYDALSKPEAVKDFYSNEQIVKMTREPTETLRQSQTIDWQKKEMSRSNMRCIVKRLLKNTATRQKDRKQPLRLLSVSANSGQIMLQIMMNEKKNILSYNSDYGNIENQAKNPN